MLRDAADSADHQLTTLLAFAQDEDRFVEHAFRDVEVAVGEMKRFGAHKLPGKIAQVPAPARFIGVQPTVGCLPRDGDSSSLRPTQQTAHVPRDEETLRLHRLNLGFGNDGCERQIGSPRALTLLRLAI